MGTIRANIPLMQSVIASIKGTTMIGISSIRGCYRLTLWNQNYGTCYTLRISMQRPSHKTYSKI